MKVVHVITDLDRGGAEGTLARLVIHLKESVEQVVVSLRGPGVWGKPLAAEGIPVHCINMGLSGLNPVDWWRVIQILRTARADVVQTWMYHADLVGGVAARIAGSGAISWGIRNLTLPPDSSRASTRFVRRMSAWLSGSTPAVIVCCSEAAAKLHAQFGYSRSKIVVIPNGIDTTHFRPDPAARNRLRAQWQVGSDTAVVGMVARWDAQKDHATLLRAVAIVKEHVPTLCCVLAGPGIDSANNRLRQMVDDAGLSGHVRLIGSSSDVVGVMNALDLHVLSSQGEAFPNVVAEAMACGTPCVATDAGDSATIIGDTGLVVPVGDSIALGVAIKRGLLEFDRSHEGLAGRRRIEQQFGLDKMAKSYETLWSRLLTRRHV